ncbi:S-adenosyl-L-methionine-dependent methyltransferase [Gigaspora margarita]|uniref:S-adenosyl-L-methionine-dependent methyltransferase n=1 Tax=Gigaspora margarita TaxID=4874 RepID=A0A8H4EFG9_GIGMA|nr:S-adenosyl-L-methionine-dependent methyltransferase [Gigaspora margarita]
MKSYNTQDFSFISDNSKDNRKHSSTSIKVDATNNKVEDKNEVISLLDKFKKIDGRDFFDIEDLNYVLPSDKLEAERANLSYILRKHLWRSNYSSPITEMLEKGGAKILDIGCGSGDWIIDMAIEYPSSTFIGIDVDSSFFPPIDKCPPNVCFLTCNVTYGIPFPKETFDFVFMSMMFAAFTEPQWSDLFEDIVRVLKYDGWVESLEPTYIQNMGKVTKWIDDAFVKASMKERGVNVHICDMISKFFELNVELTNIQCIRLECPMGDWCGCFGKYFFIFIVIE